MSVSAKKHLGQHFLNNKNIAEEIVNSLTWENYNRALEIGPGMGVLTQFLLDQNRKISAVEIDQESIDFLNEKYNGIREELPLYNEDFLKMDLSSLYQENFAVIGNFPYNISSQILFKVVDYKEIIPEVVGMFQKEVAERIAAPHGNKTYGVISVLLQAYYHIEYLFTVHENEFTPPPKVKSGVIRLQRYREKLEVDDRKFRIVVKTGFSQRRKTLRNALKTLGIPEKHKNHIFFTKRAEQLSVENFIELTKIMME